MKCLRVYLNKNQLELDSPKLEAVRRAQPIGVGRKTYREGAETGKGKNLTDYSFKPS